MDNYTDLIEMITLEEKLAVQHAFTAHVNDIADLPDAHTRGRLFAFATMLMGFEAFAELEGQPAARQQLQRLLDRLGNVSIQ